MSRDEVRTSFNRIMLAVIVGSVAISLLAACDVYFAGGTNYRPSSILDGLSVAAGAIIIKLLGNAVARFTDD